MNKYVAGSNFQSHTCVLPVAKGLINEKKANDSNIYKKNTYNIEHRRQFAKISMIHENLFQNKWTLTYTAIYIFAYKL